MGANSTRGGKGPDARSYASRSRVERSAVIDLREPQVANGHRIREDPDLQRVLMQIAKGMSTPEIAVELGRSDSAVARAASRILHSLNAPTRAAAVHNAWQEGLLP